MRKRFSLHALFSSGFKFTPLVQVAMVLCLVLGSCQAVNAQPSSLFNAGGEVKIGDARGGEIIQTQGRQSAAYSIGGPELDYYSMNPNQNPSRQVSGERGPGWMARMGYDTGPGLGREESLLFFETMPYVFWEETMFLSDLRLWRLNSGRVGGSVGAGVRWYLPNLDRTLGMIGWVDFDGTYNETFKAATVSIESRGQNFDWLSNIYLPYGQRKQQVALDFSTDSQRFVGNGVLFDQVRTSGFSLQGFDMEVGAPVGLEFARQFDVRAYAGFYNFNHEELDDIWGWKARLEANIWKYLDLNLGVTDDSTFDTRVTFAASWTLDANGELAERRNSWERMVLPPTRLWTIPKGEVAVTEAGIAAINPVTGAPLRVLHVSGNPVAPGVDAAGAGTVATPFDTIDNAVNGVNAPGIDTYDILYVHSGSTFDAQETIVVPEGKRFLGGGDRVEHFITYNDFDSARLPRAIGNYSDHAFTPDTTFDARPLYTNQGSVGGPGVTFDTLASLGGTVTSNAATEFSGFVLGNPDGTDITSGDSDGFVPTTTLTPGNGATGNGIEFVDLATSLTQLRFVDVHGANGNGLNFDTTSDTFLLESMIVNQSTNHEMFVTGGAPTITMQSSTRGETSSRVDSIIVNRDNGSAVTPDGLGGIGDNHDLAVVATTGGSINWIDVLTNDQGGDGFIITGGAQSDVSIPVTTHIENSRGNGVGIYENTAGTITIAGGRTDFLVPSNFTIINPTLNAIQIGRVTGATETTNAIVRVVNPVDIIDLNQNNSAVFVANASGDITFSGTATLDVDYTTGGAGTASGIEYFQNFGGDLTFNNQVTITDPGGAGLRITNNDTSPAGTSPGIFRTTGLSDFRIEGANRNQGVDGAGIVIGVDPPAGVPSNNAIVGTGYESLVNFGSPVTVTNRFGKGLWADGNSGEIRFSNLLDGFDSPNGVGGTSVVVLQNNTGDISFTHLNVVTGLNNRITYADDDNPTAAELATTLAAVDLRFNQGEIDLGEIDLSGTSEGIFGIDNEFIEISGGTIDMTFATGLDIFTTAPRAADPTQTVTRVDITLDDFTNGQSNDYALHLGNVKGNLTVLGGQVIQVLTGTGNEADLSDDVLAGVKLDNHEFRNRERAVAAIAQLTDPDAEPFYFGSDFGLSVDFTGLDVTQNDQGIYAREIDFLRLRNSSYTQNQDEAIDLTNIPFFQVTGSDFTQNQIGQADADDEDATIFARIGNGTGSTMGGVALNEENQQALGGEPTFYDFVVGPRNADFNDAQANDDQNTFNEPNAVYSIWVQNQATNATNPNESTNTIGILNDGFFGSENGVIINNNAFTGGGAANLLSYVFYEDLLGQANSSLNMNMAMNEFRLTGTANAPDGVIAVEHISLDIVSDDNLIFNAVDNFMVLEGAGSSAFRFIDQGDGIAFIGITDTPTDDLAEGGDAANDNFLLDPTLDPDIEIAENDLAGAFFFDLETNARVEVTNLEIQMAESADIDADQTVFEFDNVSGTTSVEISGNTILFDDSDAFVNFFNFPIIFNDMQVVQFNSVSGTVNLNSLTNNQVGVIVGGVAFALTDPSIMFDGPNSATFNGQLQFNGIFVP